MAAFGAFTKRIKASNRPPNPATETRSKPKRPPVTHSKKTALGWGFAGWGFAKKVHADDPEERLVGIRKLGEMRVTRAIPQLAERIVELEQSYEFGAERDACVDALLEMGPPAIPGLLKWNSNAENLGYTDSLDAVGSFGDASFPYLRQALSGSDERIRRSALDAISRFRSRAAPFVPQLLSIVKTEKSKTVSWAIAALGDIGEPAKAFVPVGTKLYADADENTRTGLARALGKIEPGHSAVKLEILAALQGTSERKSWALSALSYHAGQHEDWSLPEAVAPLSEILRDPTAVDHLRSRAAIYVQLYAARPVADDVVDALKVAMGATEEVVSENAVLALRKVTPDAVPAFLKEASREPLDIALAIQRILGASQLSSEVVLGEYGAILDAARHPSPLVRRAVANVLRILKAPPSMTRQAAEQLEVYATDPDPSVRGAADGSH